MSGSTGQKSSFTFGTTGVTLPIISITPPQEQVEDIAAPHLGLDHGDKIPYCPGDLVEGGEYTLELENDMNSDIPLRIEEAMTWTKPAVAPNTVGAAWSFPGYIKSVQENNIATSERATISVVVKVAGNVTKASAS